MVRIRCGEDAVRGRRADTGRSAREEQIPVRDTHARFRREVAMKRLGYARKLSSEFLQFARQNKVYWIVPLLLTLALAMLVIVGAQTTAPFIYTLF
jgi:hypothetical protein